MWVLINKKVDKVDEVIEDIYADLNGTFDVSKLVLYNFKQCDKMIEICDNYVKVKYYKKKNRNLTSVGTTIATPMPIPQEDLRKKFGIQVEPEDDDDEETLKGGVNDLYNIKTYSNEKEFRNNVIEVANSNKLLIINCIILAISLLSFLTIIIYFYQNRKKKITLITPSNGHKILY